ncbi:MAG: hypothetical protein HWE27_04735 [Gammaproteobacteria bacterium]|nr:hypothetical protein [Gammaproteobacteria bacterium]
MASWIEKPCKELLKKLNDIPEGDNKEARQLEVLTAGLTDINKELMRRAAVSARAAISGDAPEQRPQDQKAPAAEPSEKAKKAMEDVPDLDEFDSFDEELDMIEQTLIRSIGD